MLRPRSKSIAVIGAGPSGLCFALCAARLLPGYEITIFESRHENDKHGIGYTIQRPTVIALSEIIPDEPDLCSRLCSVQWAQIQIGVGEKRCVSPMRKSFGISRSELIAFLQDRLEAAGINVSFARRLDAGEVEDLRRGYCLVVGADGKESTIRNACWPKGNWTKPKSSVGWAVTETPLLCMAVNFFELGSEVAMATEYPIGQTQGCVVLDALQSTWRSKLHSDLSEGARLKSYLKVRGLELSNFRLAYPRTQVVSPFSVGNVALIGEAAVSSHHSLGAGLVIALNSALALSRCLKSSRSIAGGLASYENYMSSTLAPLHDLADSRRRWMDQVLSKPLAADLVESYIAATKVPPASFEYQLGAFVAEVLAGRREAKH